MKLLLIAFVILQAQARVIKRSSEIIFRDDENDEVESRFGVFELRSGLSFDDSDIKSEFNENLYQGDLKLTNEQENALNSPIDDENDSGGFRTGLINEKYRWKKNEEGKVAVAYKINEDAGFDSREKLTIRLAMKHIQKYTCIIFKQQTNETDYVEILNGRGCYSHLGRTGGKQELSLSKNNCFVFGTVVHELIHALGYDHMHNHEDRDNFVEIKWGNIHPEWHQAFKKVDGGMFQNFGTPYDYMSVMHYPRSAGGINGRDAIVPKKHFLGDKIGQRRGLSRGDIARLNNMYQCKKV